MMEISLEGIHDIVIDAGKAETAIKFHDRRGSIVCMTMATTDAAYLTEKMLEAFPIGSSKKECDTLLLEKYKKYKSKMERLHVSDLSLSFEEWKDLLPISDHIAQLTKEDKESEYKENQVI